MVIAGFLFFKASLSRTLSASSLLEKASVAEKSANGMPDRVRHRFINLEERRSAEGAVWRRTRSRSGRTLPAALEHKGFTIIPIDLSAARGNERMALARSITMDRNHSRSSLSQLRTICCSTLKMSGKWHSSAQSFVALIEQPTLAEVEEIATYVLRYELRRTIGASQLLKPRSL